MTGKPVKITVSLFLLLLLGCSSPKMPPEVGLAEKQDQSLRSAGAALYAPQEYKNYRDILRKGKEDLAREESRAAWFRNYKLIKTEFRAVIEQGADTLNKIEEEKKMQSGRLDARFALYRERISSLRELTLRMNGGQRAREDLMRADLMLSEASFFKARGEYQAASRKADDLSFRLRAAEKIVMPIFGRYTDKRQILIWRRWAEETIAESRKRSITVFIINKSRHSLTVYGNGRPVRTYPAGLGSNGSMDKMHAGDNATPEGRYRVVRKVTGSRYYRALLLNYPNSEDMKQFILAKGKGLIPKNSRIGGLIEIHGGGSGGLTRGCISLENSAMRQIFDIASVGTPVTIVGALQYKNNISSALRGL